MFYNKALIGYTGFIGSNILRHDSFDALYNSKNIGDIKDHEFNTVICAGAYGLKWKANKYPDEDYQSIQNLIENLRTIKTRKLILISTVDVYPKLINVDEDSLIKINDLSPYGQNRRMLELFIENNFNAIIIRLPIVFGSGLRKNIIFDLINSKFLDLIYKNSVYQFYDLNHLWDDIQKANSNNIKTLNIATEPITILEIGKTCFGIDLSKKKATQRAANYDIHTKYSMLWGNIDNYLYTKRIILIEISEFIKFYKEDRNIS